MNGSPLPAKPNLLVLVGPTAVGKTKFSLEIARQFDCEIISGDSMQVYRGMNIGTAKLLPHEQGGIRHHLLDILDPDQPFSVSDFQRLAKQAIAEIAGRGKLPFIVGGTGLYIESVLYEYNFSEAGIDEQFREREHRYAAEHGAAALHAKLKEIDPETASRLHPNDVRRIVRALEIHHVTGVAVSRQLAEQAGKSPYRHCLLGLTMDRAELYRRIGERVDAMMQSGLVAEVEGLLEQGYDARLTSMQALGYKEIIASLRGETTMEEAVALLKRDTRRFAKRQLSWFRHMAGIKWVEVGEPAKFNAHLREINDIIAAKFSLY